MDTRESRRTRRREFKFILKLIHSSSAQLKQSRNPCMLEQANNALIYSLVPTMHSSLLWNIANAGHGSCPSTWTSILRSTRQHTYCRDYLNLEGEPPRTPWTASHRSRPLRSWSKQPRRDIGLSRRVAPQSPAVPRSPIRESPD